MKKKNDKAKPESKDVFFRMPKSLYEKWTNLYPMRASVTNALIKLIEKDVVETNMEDETETADIFDTINVELGLVDLAIIRDLLDEFGKDESFLNKFGEEHVEPLYETITRAEDDLSKKVGLY